MIENLEMEARGVLEQVMSLQETPSEAKWFLNCLYRGFSPKLLSREKPEIILLGEDIPWELPKAAGTRARVILGGSLETTHWSDALLPRDADPISRSACGWLMNPHFNLAENALVLTALTSDSRRKLTGLMRDNGIRVLSVDLPPMWDRLAWQEAWVDGMARVVRAIEDHTDKTVTRSALAAAIVQHEQVRAGATAFRRASWIAGNALSPALRQLILESFWSAPKPDEWLMRLNDELEGLASAGTMAVKDNQPRLLLTGSPVIFPNFKLPLLIEEMGGLLAADETCMGEHGLYDPPAIVDPSLNGMMRALANRSTRPCTCPTFADNKRRLYRVRQMIEDYRIQGVVYHVLRGCLVYDYEYAATEAEMEKLGIPIIRVETDYNEEDVEQLRIRIEAFIELIKYGGNDT